MNAIIICVLVLAILMACIILILLMYKKNKKMANAQGRINEDFDQVEFNHRYIDVLYNLTTDSSIISELDCIKLKLDCLMPAASKKINDYDLKIKTKIDDLKINLERNNGEKSGTVTTLLRDIIVLIDERNANVREL